MPANGQGISLRSIFQRFRFRIIVTWILVLGDAGLVLLFPLFMGNAIDDYLDGSFTGLWYLASLGLLSLLLGAGRRFYDTRIYAGIYSTVAPELVDQEKARDSTVSVTSARAGLATELVEFLENSLPQIINSAIGLGGTLVIILLLNVQVFVACTIATVLIASIYLITGKRTYRLNSGYNEELERRVEVLSEDNRSFIVDHFKRLMRWNIRLSDLETTNFSLSWILLMGVLLYSIVAIVEGGVVAYGRVLAVLMYVFSYIESVIMLPLFYQQVVRLREITHRLQA